MDIWSFYEVLKEDESRVRCTLCNVTLSRGGGTGSSKKNFGTSNLNRHLQRNHHSHHEKLLAGRAAKAAKAEKRKREEDDKTEQVQIFNLRSKKSREEFVSHTITDWAKPDNKLEFYSAEAQKIHKSIFEMMVMDLRPFTTVNDPGFI